MVSEERIAWMEWCWDEETSDPESWEWREELTAEELALVESWDERFAQGVLKISEDILALSEGR